MAVFEKAAREEQYSAAKRLIAASQKEVAPRERSDEERLKLLDGRVQRAMGLWVALEEDKLIGAALIEKIDSTHSYWPLCPERRVREALERGELLELGGLTVAPAHRGRGIATNLLTLRLDFLHDAKTSVIVSTARQSGLASQAMARKRAKLIEQDAEGYLRYVWCLS